MDHVQGDGDMTTRNGWETQAAFHLVCSRGASAIPGSPIDYDVKLYLSPDLRSSSCGFPPIKNLLISSFGQRLLGRQVGTSSLSE